MKQITSLTGHRGAKDIYSYRYSKFMYAYKNYAELAGIILGDGSISIYPKINHYRFNFKF